MVLGGQLALLGLSISLALAGCRGCSSAPSGPPQGAAPQDSPPQTQSDSPVVNLAGTEAQYDLGPVPLNSKHVIVLVVSNPSDRPLVFRTVRGDCECISAENAPNGVPAGGSARISVSYVAPKEAIEYEGRLLIATDDPSRRLISLRVKSRPPG